MKEKIEDGAKVHLRLKYGLITFFNGEQDLCDQVKEVDKECPIEKGPLAITKSVDLPNEIPYVSYRYMESATIIPLEPSKEMQLS